MMAKIHYVARTETRLTDLIDAAFHWAGRGFIAGDGQGTFIHTHIYIYIYVCAHFNETFPICIYICMYI